MANALDKHCSLRGNWPLAWVAVTIFLLLFGAILASSAYDDYGNTLTQEYRTLESQARLGEVQIAGALRSLNLLLQSVIADAQAVPRLPSQIIEQRQASLLRQSPEIHYLITVDNHGQVTTVESLDDPGGLATVKAFNASQRDYFTGHRDAKPADYYNYQISRPFKTITNHYTITISRAIRGKNGEFQGVALISVLPTYFDSVLQQVLSNEVLDAAAVHNRFGDIIYRLPNPEKYIGKNIAGGTAFKSYLSSDQHLTRYLGVTATDNVNRILVFSKVGDTNLDIGVSGQFDVVMAKWRSDALMKILIFVTVAGLSLTLAWVVQCHLREREWAVEALRESQRIAHLGGWSIDLASGNLAWTDETFLLHELPIGEQPTVEQAINYYLPDSRKVIEQAVKDALENGKPFDLELQIKTARGHVRWVHARGQAKDRAGAPSVVSGTFQDITERKQIDAERNRLLRIIDEATDLIATSDMAGHIKSLNAAGARMVGLPDDVDIKTFDIKDFHPAWAARKIAEEAIPTALKKGAWQGECALLHRDGHEIPTSQMVLVHRDDAGKPLYISTIIRDVTERKQVEVELKRSNAELEQFSYAISHDMRQPLRMITSYLQLLDRELGETLNAERREYLNFATDGARRLDKMLIGLLEYSRVGRIGEPPVNAESRALLEEALFYLQPAIDEAAAEVRIHGHWPAVWVSQDEILRLLQNLIGNSIKFRVVQRKPEITVTSETSDSEWRVCVADNGVGILPDQIERLFQVFQRLQSRSTYEGTGIGLALCRKIVEHHQGRIWAESAGEGQGSRFYFALPQRSASISG